MSKMTSKKWKKKIIIFLLVTLFIKNDEQGDEKKMMTGKRTENWIFENNINDNKSFFCKSSF
jgi:hypothetical protein